MQRRESSASAQPTSEASFHFSVFHLEPKCPLGFWRTRIQLRNTSSPKSMSFWLLLRRPYSMERRASWKLCAEKPMPLPGP